MGREGCRQSAPGDGKRGRWAFSQGRVGTSTSGGLPRAKHGSHSLLNTLGARSICPLILQRKSWPHGAQGADESSQAVLESKPASSGSQGKGCNFEALAMFEWGFAASLRLGRVGR